MMRAPRLALAVLGLAALTTAAVPATAAPSETASRPGSPYTFAVIGDIPYGAQQVADFPRVVDQINADPDVALVDHLGDIKSGSSVCSDDYYSLIKTQFDRFADPLVYTPGDNEWTDCHRPNNGAYNPLERLDRVRDVFFAEPGRTLGCSVGVRSYVRDGFPENVRYARADVSFGVAHIVGSNNGLVPWTGNTTATPEQTAEVLGRTAAAITTIRDTFARARADRHRAVVIMTQADMFDPTVANPTYADLYAFTPIVQTLAIEAAAFRGPVYLFNGDSHVYNADRPLAAGSSWLELYGVAGPVGNLQRITVDGSENNDNYLKVTIAPRGREVLRWTRVPYTG